MAARKNTTTPSNKKPNPPSSKRKGSKNSDVSSEPKPGEPLKAGLLETAQKHVKPSKEPPPPREAKLENFERELPCKLTDSQLLDKSRERSYLGSLIDTKQAELEQKKKSVKQEIESMQLKIDELEAQDKQLRLQIQAGAQNRIVACQRVFDYSLAQVREVRIDMVPHTLLGEPRAMTPAELDEGRGNWNGTAFENVKVADPAKADGEDIDDDEGVVDDSYGKPNPITGLSDEDEDDLNAEPVFDED